MPNGKVPTIVGVPLKVPLLARLIPVGSEPLVTAKPYGGVPPVATRDGVYALPVNAVGRIWGARVNCEETDSVKVPLVVLFWGLLLSTRWTVNVNAPPPVGVPIKTPPVESVMPGGKVPVASVHVSGPTPPCSRRISV